VLEIRWAGQAMGTRAHLFLLWLGLREGKAQVEGVGGMTGNAARGGGLGRQ